MTDGPVCDLAAFKIGTRQFSVEIAPSCSGYEGIGLNCVFLGVFLCLFRERLRFPRALVLLPLGAALIWSLNALRIFALIVIGTWISPAIAMGGFHSLAGWLAQIVVFLGLVVVAKKSSWLAAAFAAEFAFAAKPLAALSRTPGRVAGHGPGERGRCRQNRLAVRRGYPDLGSRAPGLPPRLRSMGPARLSGGDSAGRMASGAVDLPPVWTGQHGIVAWALEQAVDALPGWWRASWLILRILGSALIVPIAEELAFRGFLARRLIAAEFEEVPFGTFTWFSFLLSSLLFGAMHQSVLAGTAAGAVYAVATYQRGRLSDAVASHSTTNLLIAVQVLFGNACGLWL